ncbi:2-nitropropane dioxygenase [Infundibulicybe gibba]|nr:2-nitropropane dioxygenase [Infundibulicybe gibba]
MSIVTKLSKLLGIRTPVVAPPMAGASGGALAARVTHGGGFGLLSAGYDSPDKFRSQLALARSLLQIDAPAQLPIGAGYLAWQLEAPNSPAHELLDIALQENVQAVWFAFGNDLGRWAKYVRDHDKKSSKKTIIFIQVSSVDEAVTAASTWGADVLVAQGIESGGHGSGLASSMMTLTSDILSTEISIPVLGAGGLSNGAHIASLLALGASGVVLGTRFLLTPESLYSDVQKQALLAANSTLSTRTMAFDYARGTLGWPPNIDGRGLRNSTVADFENGIDIETLRDRFNAGVRENNPDRLIVWAGTGIGQMNRVQPASEIVKELHYECVERMRAITQMLPSDR